MLQTVTVGAALNKQRKSDIYKGSKGIKKQRVNLQKAPYSASVFRQEFQNHLQHGLTDPLPQSSTTLPARQDGKCSTHTAMVRLNVNFIKVLVTITL